MTFASRQLGIVKRLALCATIYQNAFLKDSCYKTQFHDNYVALACFLEHYAYERQGAAPAYPVLAVRAVERVFEGKINVITAVDAKESWRIYQEIATSDFNKLKVNRSHNPLNSNGGVLATTAKCQVSNIANHIKTLIQEGKTVKAHEFISSIRGIGKKIASFYIRDIAYLSDLDENAIRDPFYLQPIDTWLEQTISIILGNNILERLEEKQKTIVELCKQAKCSPIAFNQGAWVLGSQIAGDFNTFKRIACGENCREIVEEHISDLKAYIFEVEKIIHKIC